MQILCCVCLSFLCGTQKKIFCIILVLVITEFHCMDKKKKKRVRPEKFLKICFFHVPQKKVSYTCLVRHGVSKWVLNCEFSVLSNYPLKCGREGEGKNETDLNSKDALDSICPWIILTRQARHHQCVASLDQCLKYLWFSDSALFERALKSTLKWQAIIFDSTDLTCTYTHKEQHTFLFIKDAI